MCPPSQWRTSTDPVLFTLHWLVRSHINTKVKCFFWVFGEFYKKQRRKICLISNQTVLFFFLCISGITGILMSAAALPVCLTRPPKLVLHPPPVSKSDIKPVPGFGHCCRKTTKKQARKGKDWRQNTVPKETEYRRPMLWFLLLKKIFYHQSELDQNETLHLQVKLQRRW